MKNYEVESSKGELKHEGYIAEMPEAYYHSTEGFISKSSLYVLKQSAFKFFSGVRFTATKAMQMGTAIHCAILEPEKFSKEFKMLPDVKDRRQKEYKDAVKEFGAERVFVGAEVMNIIRMRTAIMGNDFANELLSLDGHSEVSGFHTDEETGVNIRHRFDRLTNCGIGIDIKKTQSVHPDDLAKTIAKYGYHTQEAVYSDAYRQITGRELKQFYFIFVEEKYPKFQSAIIEKIQLIEEAKITTEEGKKVIQNEMRLAMNAILSRGKVEKIFFHNMIME